MVLAVISAREGNRNETHGYLDRAREVAAEVGPGRNDFGTEFGPTNVTIHAVTTAVDLGDAAMALSIADDFDVSDLSPERRARLKLDKARAYVQRRQVGEAVAALLAAEKLTPEYIQTHFLVRQTIRDLMQVSVHTPAELLDLAERFRSPVAPTHTARRITERSHRSPSSWPLTANATMHLDAISVAPIARPAEASTWTVPPVTMYGTTAIQTPIRPVHPSVGTSV